MPLVTGFTRRRRVPVDLSITRKDVYIPRTRTAPCSIYIPTECNHGNHHHKPRAKTAMSQTQGKSPVQVVGERVQHYWGRTTGYLKWDFEEIGSAEHDQWWTCTVSLRRSLSAEWEAMGTSEAFTNKKEAKNDAALLALAYLTQIGFP
ncbi:hypothetical protein FRC18_000024 [Serendipita sp. 400]|nr:hypothetical protein FRC18_000024 [Serendipita sp. 400]